MKIAKITVVLFCWTFCSAFICAAQDTTTSGGVVANLNAAINSKGTLQGTLVITAIGAPSLPFREAFVKNAAGGPSATLLGRFTKDRESHATPVVIDDGNQERPIKIQFQIREDDFILPIQRQMPLQLDLLTLVSPLVSQPDGNLRLGAPGKFREEISLEIPADFALDADARLNNENTFARYQSDAKTGGGKLVIVREFQLKQEIIDSPKRTDVDSFWKMIGDDQKRAFMLRRTKRVDLTEWIQSVPADKIRAYGLQAYSQREYDASRQLFERATRANPDDSAAWNNLGNALDSLGRWDEAQKALEKQIAINPKSSYAYRNLGLLQEREGYWDMAIDNFRKQIEVHPGDPAAIADLPRALMVAHRWAEAEEAAAKALQLQPKNAQQQLDVAIAQVCQGKLTPERPAIDSALGTVPTANLLNYAAYFLTECDKENLADPYISRAVESLNVTGVAHENMATAMNFQRSRASYLDTYGWLLYKKGENDRALSLLNAAANLAPLGTLYVHLAQAESKAGHSDKAALFWREATFLQPGQLPHVPPDIAPRIESIPPLSLDRVWYPLGADLPGDVAAILPVGQPSYFFLAANADGSVASVRELDTEDQAAKRVLTALRAIKLPAIQVEVNPVPTAYLVKLVRGADGNVVAGRSVSQEAVAIAADLMPGEFPLPASATSPTAPSTQSPADTYRIGGGVSPPSITYKVEPEYTEEARKARLQGTVLLRIIVTTDGTPRDIKVLRSLGLGLDEKAIAAVGQWQFQPGRKSGQPVNVLAQIEVNFRLASSWHLGRAEFHLPDGVLRPILDKVATPHVANDALSAAATVTFDIGENGAPLNLRIDKSSADDWARSVTEALDKWRFTPASKDGRPVVASCTMDFVRGN